MKEFNAEQTRVESAAALKTVQQFEAESPYAAYVGLDVHKDTVAIAWPGRDEPEYWGEIKHTRKAVEKLIGRLSEARGGHDQWNRRSSSVEYAAIVTSAKNQKTDEIFGLIRQLFEQLGSTALSGGCPPARPAFD